MSQGSKTILINVFSGAVLVVVIAGFVVYFQYHPFHWWMLIAPALSIPLVVIADRRQRHWADLRRQRELSDAKAAEHDPSN
jgi:hypothetical protein